MKACQLLTRLFILSVVIFSFLPADLYGNTAVSIEQAEKMLREGNQRFASGKMKYPNLDDSRLRQVSSGQDPWATVITCSDSRVPVEQVFDAGLGDIFVIRVAGNVCDVDEIGSIEYGVDHLATPVLVVLGHTHCGAVTAVVTEAEVHGSIPPLVDNIAPAVSRVKSDYPDLHGKEEVVKGRELAEKAAGSLSGIVDLSEGVMNMIQQLSSASEEQASASQQITQSVDEISNIIKESSVGAEQSAAAAEQLNRQAESLKSIVDNFKTR